MVEVVKKPSFKDMTRAAIGALKERNGSSIHAITKYIGQTYSLDMEKSKTYLKRYLKKAVSDGEVIQTRGTGLSGSFKLAAEKPKPKTKSNRKKTKKDPDAQVDTNDKENENESETIPKPKKAASKRTLGPKMSANLKEPKKKKVKDSIKIEVSTKKKAAKKSGDDDAATKMKPRKGGASKNSRKSMTRASLIGGTKIKKPSKKTAKKILKQAPVANNTD